MTRTADQIFAESFLEVRAKLLEVAATLDRTENAGQLTGTTAENRSKIDQALQICLSDAPDRAEQIQQLFSRPFDPQWREQMKIKTSPQ